MTLKTGFAADSGTTRDKLGKIVIFKPSRFEPLYQPYFGFWLFAWSRSVQEWKNRTPNATN